MSPGDHLDPREGPWTTQPARHVERGAAGPFHIETLTSGVCFFKTSEASRSFISGKKMHVENRVAN